MTVLENFTFFKEATAAGDGLVLKNIHGAALTLCVSGTFVGTLVVNGTQSDVESVLSVVNLADLSTTSSITAAGNYAVICVHGFEDISVSISEYTSGSITVTGRLVTD